MSFKSSNYIFDKYRALYGSSDETTTPSNGTSFISGDTGFDRFGEEFGISVAVGSGRIVVGAPYRSETFIFDLDGTQLDKITPSGGATNVDFGCSVAVGSGRIVVGSKGDDDTATNSGAAYIFDLDGTQLAKIKAADVSAAYDYFGWSVAVGSGRIVVGSPYDADNGSNSGSAYIFDLGGTQLAKIKASDGATGDFFSFSVAVGSGRIVVGAFSDDDNGATSGSAYIFDLDGNQLAKIKPSDGASFDQFGRSVAVDSGRIVVGAYGDDDNGSNSGSAYIFDLDGTQLAKIDASDGAANDYFGNSIAVGSGRICVGAYGDSDNGPASGSAYIFNLDGTQLAKIDASDGATFDQFGWSVAVGSGRIVVGAPQKEDSATGFPSAGSAYIWNTPLVKDLLDDNF